MIRYLLPASATPPPEMSSSGDALTFWIAGALMVLVFGGLVLRVLLRNRLKK